MDFPRRQRGWRQVPTGRAGSEGGVAKGGLGAGRSQTQVQSRPRSSRRRRITTPCYNRLWPWGWDHGLLGRSQGSGQKGGDGQHQPVAAYARGFLAAHLVPFPADRFDTSKAQFNPVTAGGASKEAPFGPLGCR